jgi:hypothetical protein
VPTDFLRLRGADAAQAAGQPQQVRQGAPVGLGRVTPSELRRLADRLRSAAGRLEAALLQIPTIEHVRHLHQADQEARGAVSSAGALARMLRDEASAIERARRPRERRKAVSDML